MLVGCRAVVLGMAAVVGIVVVVVGIVVVVAVVVEGCATFPRVVLLSPCRCLLLLHRPTRSFTSPTPAVLRQT